MIGATAQIANALTERERLYRDGIARLRELSSDEAENEVYDITFLLREAVDLVGVLRRLMPSASDKGMHDAFGAPGDWGYGAPIGAALDTFYRRLHQTSES